MAAAAAVTVAVEVAENEIAFSLFFAVATVVAVTAAKVPEQLLCDKEKAVGEAEQQLWKKLRS